MDWTNHQLFEKRQCKFYMQWQVEKRIENNLIIHNNS